MTRGGNTVGSDNRGRSVQNFPYPEFLKHREEGRCFRCGGPFGAGHHCLERSLRVVLLAEDEEENAKVEGVEDDHSQMELSAFSVGGLTQPKTMKLQGTVGEKTMLILIDSGVSHNFVGRELVEELGLTVEDTPPYQVSLGDGQKKRTRGCCPIVVVNLGGAEIEERFHLFELGGVDMILGVEWLAKLGEVTLNWGELTMAYISKEGRKLLLRETPLYRRK